MRRVVLLLTASAVVLAAQPALAQVPGPPPGSAAAEPLPTERVPEHLAYLEAARAQAPAEVQQQLYAGGRRWLAGDTLKVCFFGGNSVVKSLIAQVAREWESYANLKLDFGQPGVWRDCTQTSSGFSQIRIGFAEKGYWSAVGTDSREVLSPYQPSMNLNGFDYRYNGGKVSPSGAFFTPANVAAESAERDRGTIRHEFGHALGLLHEHQNPSLGCYNEIRWNGPNNVYDYYGGYPNYWSPDEVNRNLGPISRTDPDWKSGVPDRDSVMIYAQPAAIFINGPASVCFVPERNAISPHDKQIVAQLYPATAAAISDVAFTTTSSAGVASAALVGPALQTDRLARIRADLSSDDTSVRREARRQLALEIDSTASPTFVADLLQDATKQGYRQQLGVLVAIDKSKPVAKPAAADTADIRSSLNTMAANSDDTLRRYTARAKGKLQVQ